MNNKLTGKDFYNLIRIRFADCWDEVKHYVPLCAPKALNDNKNLSHVLTGLFAFYAGRILEDAEQTGLYKGPAIHRVHTIMDNYCNDAALLWVLGDRDLDDSNHNDEARHLCYRDLNSIGSSK